MPHQHTFPTNNRPSIPFLDLNRQFVETPETERENEQQMAILEVRGGGI